MAKISPLVHSIFEDLHSTPLEYSIERRVTSSGNVNTHYVSPPTDTVGSSGLSPGPFTYLLLMNAFEDHKDSCNHIGLRSDVQRCCVFIGGLRYEA